MCVTKSCDGLECISKQELEGNHQRHTRTMNVSPPTQDNNATRTTNGNPPTPIPDQVQGWNRIELMRTNIEHARTSAAFYTLLMRSLNLGMPLQGLYEAAILLVAVYGRSLTGVTTSSGSHSYKSQRDVMVWHAEAIRN